MRIWTVGFVVQVGFVGPCLLFRAGAWQIPRARTTTTSLNKTKRRRCSASSTPQQAMLFSSSSLSSFDSSSSVTDSQYYLNMDESARNCNNNNNNAGVRITLTRYLEDVAKQNPELQDMVSLLSAVRMACKTISNLVHRAGLSIPHDDVTRNSNKLDGRYYSMQRLDQLSTTVLKNALKYTGKCQVVAPPVVDSGEAVPEHQPGVLIAKPTDSNYVACLDPLDGSGNADASICTGTVFGVFYDPAAQRDDKDERALQLTDDTAPLSAETTREWMESVLQPARNMKAAGYCMYSSATVLVFTLGDGTVQAFTLDPVIQEFVLTHANLSIPNTGSVYSVNEGNSEHGWNKGFREYLYALKTGTGRSKKMYAHRYVGSMVGDIHRTLLYGGIFCYPSDRVRHPSGNLQLLYKIAPMAFVMENAGGKSITESGTTSILDVRPQRVHQKSPCFMGSPEDVEECASYLAKTAERGDKPILLP